MPVDNKYEGLYPTLNILWQYYSVHRQFVAVAEIKFLNTLLAVRFLIWE